MIQQVKTNKSITRGVLFLFALIIFSFQSKAQKGYEAGAWLGVSNYFGDLNTSSDITRPGIAFGVIAKRNFNERLSLRGSLNYGRVSGDDAESSNNFERNRNLSFKASIIDFTTVMEFNFLPFIHGSTDQFYTPYLIGGFNISRFNPSAELNGERYSLRDLGTEGQAETGTYSLITGGLVIGGGWKWDISNDVSLNVELSYKRLFTDYLDDVSTIYPSPGSLSSSEAIALSDRSLIDGQGAPGRQRGDSKGNDAYTFFGVSILRYWGKLECPKISDW